MGYRNIDYVFCTGWFGLIRNHDGVGPFKTINSNGILNVAKLYGENAAIPWPARLQQQS
jgi:hypothetical protein